MDTPLRPILLLADSQLLFWQPGGMPFLRSLWQEHGDTEAPARAAYLGASNEDRPEFFELFQAAMDLGGVPSCRAIPAQPSAEDRAFLDTAELVLLAGGDPWRGWQAFEAADLLGRILERYYAGAWLMGVSAGAIQLGLYGEGAEGFFDGFRLVPFLLAVHDEPDWPGLHASLQKAAAAELEVRGLGIPSGGGALFHPDSHLEPVRRPLIELPGLGHEPVMLLPPSNALAVP